MALNHRTRPVPSFWKKEQCRKCKKKTACQILEADRRSSNGGYREFVVGLYCNHCAEGLVQAAWRKARRAGLANGG